MREEEKMRVLVVDDDELQLELMERMLRLDNIEVATLSGPIGVSNRVRSFKPDVVLLDANMPALSGHLLLGIVRRHASPDTKLILFSACDESRLRQLASDAKADGWIPKSTSATELVRRLRLLWRPPPRPPAG